MDRDWIEIDNWKSVLTMPEDPSDSGFQIAAKADLGTIFEGVTLNPVVEYWNSGYSISGFDYTLSNFQLGAEGHYTINMLKGYM